MDHSVAVSDVTDEMFDDLVVDNISEVDSCDFDDFVANLGKHRGRKHKYRNGEDKSLLSNQNGQNGRHANASSSSSKKFQFLTPVERRQHEEHLKEVKRMKKLKHNLQQTFWVISG